MMGAPTGPHRSCQAVVMDNRGTLTGFSTPDPNCELCEAAPLTERYFEDDLCWIAECEACFVPMVVWKAHDPSPSEEARVMMIERLQTIAGRVLGADYYIDDRLRSIPDHYHAHARRRWGSRV